MAKAKRPRIVQGKNTATFQNAEQLIDALRSRNPDALKNSLVSFRNQITVGHTERPSVGDARVLLVTSWLERSPGATELFDIWDTGSNYTSLILVSLAHTLTLLSGAPTGSTHAPVILRALFDSTHARRLNAHLAGGQTDVVLAALKVLGAAAAIDQRLTFDVVAWTAKALPKLFSHRHRTPTSQPLVHTSVRTALTTLILALLPFTLSLDLFPALFKGLAQDDGVIIKLVLETCWEKVWCDVKVPKSLKVKVFGGLSIYIQPLYERRDPDSTDPLAPADVVHHFLLALCTKPGTGLCFRSRGWYPRPSGNPLHDHEPTDKPKGEHQAGEEDGDFLGKGTLYNPLLLKLLRLLRPATDARQHELAVRILNACPDLIGAYFGKGPAPIGLSLEPRLSTRWITSTGFISAIVKTPVPVDSFYVDVPAHSLAKIPSAQTRKYRADPPPLTAIVENIVPSVLTRAWLTKGLLARSTGSAIQAEQGLPSSTSGTLVQHTTIRLITQCLLKLSDVLAACPRGWSERTAEVVDAVRKRVPELGVVVGVVQEATKVLQKDSDHEYQIIDNGKKVRGLLLAEGALRLLWLYARVLPGTMAETRFDVGKLLQETEVNDDPVKKVDETNGLRVMCQIHMLRLLGESDQFVWSAKPPGSSNTHMYRLLSLHLRTPHTQLRAASAALIVRLLGSSVLFEHDPKEAHAWIQALPRNKHPASPDSDDITIFLAFFDDVLSRSIKTPYKYLELGIQLYTTNSGRVECMLSPLIMAVLEQLRFKPMEMSARRLVTTFVARLIKLSVGKMEVAGAKAIAGYMRDIFTKEGETNTRIRVVSKLEAFLQDLDSAEVVMGMDADTGTTSSSEAIRFVGEVENMAVDNNEVARMRAASKILDWVRTSEEILGVSEVVRLARVFVAWSTDRVALEEFLEELGLGRHPALVSGLANDTEVRNTITDVISFPQAFWILVSQKSNIMFAREALSNSVIRQPNELLAWSCGLVAHRLEVATHPSENVIQSCINALTVISQHAVGMPEADEVKQTLFVSLPAIKTLLTDSRSTAQLEGIVSTLLSEDNETDRALAAPYSRHWSSCLLEAPTDHEFEERAAGFTIWIPFTVGSTCVQIFKSTLDRVRDWSSVSLNVRSLLESLANHLRSIALDKSDARQLSSTIPKLIKIPTLSQYHNLLRIAPAIAERELPLGLDLSYTDTNEGLVKISQKALDRWLSGSGVLNSMSWTGFSGWVDTEEFARLSTTLMYLSSSARASFSTWIGQQSSLNSRSIGPCFALVDCYIALVQNNPDQPCLPRVTVDKILDCAARVLFKHGESDERRRWAAHIFTRMMKLPPDDTKQLGQIIAKRLPSNHGDLFHLSSISLFAYAAPQQPHWGDLLDSVVDSGLLWLVRRFAEDDADSHELEACLPIFEKLFLRTSNIKPHLAEPVLVAAIKNRLQSNCVTSLCSSIVMHTSLKPMSINKLLQSIIHHPSFNIVGRARSPTKDGVVMLLHSLFHKHPSGTCHPSHIIPLLQIYRGTMDRSDTQILSIFQLFEKSRQISTLNILKNWAPESHTRPMDLLGAVCNFDPVTMFRTCTSFPQRRDSHCVNLGPEESRSDIYDPNFVLPLLAALMVSDEPITNLQWVELCRTNVLSLAVASLSSKHSTMRQLGYASLVTAYARFPDVDFQERAQLTYTLDLLRNLIPQPVSTPSHPIPRLPTYTTLLLSHALRDIFTPATLLYPVISRFLLQRPEFDIKDVPLLYTLLYSSSGEWKRERGWMIRFLADGMRSTKDWRVLKRRHTWDLLASLLQSALEDRTLRLSILEVLVNASGNKHAATSLLLGSSILSWVHMQLGHVLPGEELAYLKVLENMAIVVDHEQIEKATMGHWRDDIAEIVGKIIRIHKSDSSLLFLAAQLFLRLTITLENTPPSFLQPVKIMLDALSEHNPSLENSSTKISLLATGSNSLHTNRSLLQPIPGTPLEQWCATLYALWRVSMETEPGSPLNWVNLTSKILFANSVPGAEFSEFAWIREEMVACITIQESR